MICTRTEIKQILQISGTDQDDLIDLLIPIVENDLFEYTNNYFLDKNIEYESNNISFLNASTPLIYDSNNGFGIFKGGQHLNISGSYYNNGNILADTIADGIIYVDSKDILITEDSTLITIAIRSVTYPKLLKVLMSQMIDHRINNISSSNIMSESIGNYNITYASDRYMSSVPFAYPKSIAATLYNFRKLRW